jgi:hypothetical protein
VGAGGAFFWLSPLTVVWGLPARFTSSGAQAIAGSIVGQASRLSNILESKGTEELRGVPVS